MQAQNALARKDFVGATKLLEAGLLEHNPDDWAGFLLLFACKLPGTALPFADAAHGIFDTEGGFGTLAPLLSTDAFWADAKAACGAEEAEVAVEYLEGVIERAVAQVCARLCMLWRATPLTRVCRLRLRRFCELSVTTSQQCASQHVSVLHCYHASAEARRIARLPVMHLTLVDTSMPPRPTSALLRACRWSRRSMRRQGVAWRGAHTSRVWTWRGDALCCA